MAGRTIQGYEAVHMIRKRQVRWVAGDDLLPADSVHRIPFRLGSLRTHHRRSATNLSALETCNTTVTKLIEDVFLLSSENVGLPPVKIVWNKSFNSQLSSLIALKDRCALSVNDINGSIGEVHLTWFAVTQDLRFLLPFAFDGLQPVGQATTLSIVIRPSPFFDHSAAAAGSSRLKSQ